jgi:hypothetical protein
MDPSTTNMPAQSQPEVSNHSRRIGRTARSTKGTARPGRNKWSTRSPPLSPAIAFALLPQTVTSAELESGRHQPSGESNAAQLTTARLLKFREFRLCFFHKRDLSIGILPQA